ncbi:VanZ family protein [Streptomyces sp. NBC_00102]|uniref:VanZ family protein n=1 Tax=Streptomyces sp. NBC_00102 TaxID=2975652 RepID=UPI0022506330|nr:VanZ family protein [Streptomyces sp. NBC_00102]MCX5400490.1 VanZ family protein [Streptomyces sp. NBC_00102]
MDIRFQVDAALLGPLLVVCAAGAAYKVWRAAWTERQALLRLATAVYAAGVLSMTIFPPDVTWGMCANQASWIGQIGFVPLLTADITIVANVIMMMPAGFLLPLVSGRAASPKHTALMTAVAGLAVEAAQLLSYIALNNGRSVDINDILASTLGGYIGFVLLPLALRSPALRGSLVTAALPGSAALRADRDRAAAAPPEEVPARTDRPSRHPSLTVSRPRLPPVPGRTTSAIRT